MTPQESYPEIVDCVRAYIHGMCHAEPDLLRRSMHPKACSIGHIDGGTEWDHREAFIETVQAAVKTPDPDPWFRINSIAVTGDTAVVRVEDIWLGDHYDDTLTLLHVGGAWVIVSKVFYLRPSG